MLQIHSSLRVAGRLKKANIECVVLAGSSFILCEWCTLFQMTRCVCILGVHRDRIFKGKWRSRGLNELNFFLASQGRRLKAGAAKAPRGRRGQAWALGLFTKKPIYLLHLLGAGPGTLALYRRQAPHAHKAKPDPPCRGPRSRTIKAAPTSCYYESISITCGCMNALPYNLLVKLTFSSQESRHGTSCASACT